MRIAYIELNGTLCRIGYRFEPACKESDSTPGASASVDILKVSYKSRNDISGMLSVNTIEFIESQILSENGHRAL